jgi:hypothetical protein
MGYKARLELDQKLSRYARPKRSQLGSRGWPRPSSLQFQAAIATFYVKPLSWPRQWAPCPRCPIFVDPIHQLLLSNQGSASLHPLVQSGICTALSSGLHRFICLHGFIRWSSHWFVHHPRDSTVHIKDIHSTVVDVLVEVMPYSLLQFRLVHLHTPIELHILFLEYLYSNASTSKFSLF